MKSAPESGGTSTRDGRLVAVWTGVFCLLLILTARSGPDYHHYLEWGRAALRGDIFSLESDTRSPLSVPVSQWSHGPGFIFAIPRLIVGDALKEPPAGRIAGAAFSIIFYVSMWGLLVIATRGSRILCILGLVFTFLATHGGYYSIVHASESVSLAAFAVLTWCTVGALRDGAGGFLCFAAGCASGLMITARAQLVPAALLCLTVCMVALWRSQRLSRTSFVISAAGLAVPFGAAVAQVALTRRWMTGSLWKSPYLFGDAQWSSVDPGSAKIYEVLFHPWHGVFLYHPAYLIGMLWLARRIWTAPTLALRAVWLAAVVICTLHLVHQSSWYCWWLGLGTFGGRGFAFATVWLVPLLAAEWRDRVGARVLPWLCTFATLWSILLLWQGNSNHVSWNAFRMGIIALAARPDFFITFVPLVICFIYTFFESRRGGTAGAAARSLAICGIAHIFLYLFRRFLVIYTPIPSASETSVFLSTVATVVGIAGGRVLCGNLSVPVTLTPWVRNAALAVVSVVFVTSAILFGRLAWKTEDAITSGRADATAASKPYRATLPWSLQAFDEAISEYTLIDGYEKEKIAMDAFRARVVR